VVHISVASASDATRTFAAFSLRTTTNAEINFCLTLERLGTLISHGLGITEKHVRELRRPFRLGGTVAAVVTTPDSVTVSFADVSGERVTRLVISFGDLSLCFLVKPDLVREMLEKFVAGPAGASIDLNRLVLHLPIGPNITELKLPVHSQAITPFETSMLPINWSSYVGFITVLWGDFETRMDELTEKLAAENKIVLPHKWNIQDFKKRRKLFLDMARTLFAGQKTLIDYCELLIQDAIKLHLPRNMLVHGRLHGGMLGQDYLLVAELERAGQTYRANFQEPELLTMYHEIANLVGRLRFLLNPDDSPRKPQPFSSQEKQFLRGLRLNNHQTPATDPTPSAPPESSQA
jgi:hypothetical protein